MAYRGRVYILGREFASEVQTRLVFGGVMRFLAAWSLTRRVLTSS